MARSALKNIFVSCLIGVLLAGCAFFQEDDVTFARKTMEQLIEGRYAARLRFDWSRLKILGKEVGRQCAQYKTEQERIDYARSFIRAFSESYKKTGAKASAFFDWRFADPQKVIAPPGTTVVTAYCYDKTSLFLFFITRDKKTRKVTEIMLIRPVDQAKAAPAQKGSVNDVAP